MSLTQSSVVPAPPADTGSTVARLSLVDIPPERTRSVAHNCRNCGGPWGAESTAGRWVCQHCSTIEYPEPSRDGILTVYEPADTSCPQCQQGLVLGWAGKTPVEWCPGCEGLLLPMARFYATIQELRATSQRPAFPANPLNAAHLKRETTCPGCNFQMETHAYSGGGNCVIDTCSGCALIWLDREELSALVHYSGRVHRPG